MFKFISKQGLHAATWALVAPYHIVLALMALIISVVRLTIWKSFSTILFGVVVLEALEYYQNVRIMSWVFKDKSLTDRAIWWYTIGICSYLMIDRIILQTIQTVMKSHRSQTTQLIANHQYIDAVAHAIFGLALTLSIVGVLVWLVYTNRDTICLVVVDAIRKQLLASSHIDDAL